MRHIVNPISTVVLAPLISVPQLLGLIYWNNLKATILCTCLMALIFIGTYLLGISAAEDYVRRHEEIV